MINRLIYFFSIVILSVATPRALYAQKPVILNDKLDQHIFQFNEIEIFEDPSETLTLAQVKERHFTPSTTSTPQTTNLRSAYWFKIKIDGNSMKGNRHFLLEFFDQTIDEITVFIPDRSGRYTSKVLGDNYRFQQREIIHKNFEIPIENLEGEQTYYFKIKSWQRADIIIVLRSVNWFIHYALDEYFSFGIFYGMILVFSFYNLLMFFAIRQKQYLYYVLYILSIGLYEMSTDGIAYQYLWPAFPEWNQYAFGVALFLVSTFSLLFTKELLFVKAKAPSLNKLLNVLIILGAIYFTAGMVIYRPLFNYKFFEFIPLSAAFYTGIHIWRNGYRPARFFVLGYGFLFLGFSLKLLILLSDGSLNIGVLSYYSLSLCFIIEMILLSFAIGDKVRILKHKKDKAQRRIILQMKETEKLKDRVNKELETQVQHRTREVVEKSAIIESQNEDLKAMNLMLKEQAEEISRMNVLLEQDNIELQTNIEKVSRARVMSAEVDFTEFSRIYPDNESCYKFLSELKWEKGYTCSKCGSANYFNGHTPYSRRCSKCSYEESVTTNTILHNTRIPVNKAFYMIFLLYSTKGKISSHKLSEILGIRQSTCWAYSSRIKKIMDERKKEIKNAGEKGWSKLVLE
ncbi:7TM diverse intracellular signaling domain-containing protein [Pararcticibacter amylolyticus]|uniref:Chromosome partitioning protein ParA n=1 Tax=Pararcticibacter amylolyticus TaxID=2173175 RepID=A0A2U2PCE6_9SPHI|nr:7TM diverse intracellular signaling domain-containing protein [Pararcticibacter amylolyticus]PWG79078.1 chromosome partitioning protein ParA [Pararcticibacter amylolyticus]